MFKKSILQSIPNFFVLGWPPVFTGFVINPNENLKTKNHILRSFTRYCLSVHSYTWYLKSEKIISKPFHDKIQALRKFIDLICVKQITNTLGIARALSGAWLGCLWRWVRLVELYPWVVRAHLGVDRAATEGFLSKLNFSS